MWLLGVILLWCFWLFVCFLRFCGGLGSISWLGRVSVGEVLMLLSKMKLIVESGGREFLCALPKRTEQILEVFLI
jgi:hypothetical protein